MKKNEGLKSAKLKNLSNFLQTYVTTSKDREGEVFNAGYTSICDENAALPCLRAEWTTSCNPSIKKMLNLSSDPDSLEGLVASLSFFALRGEEKSLQFESEKELHQLLNQVDDYVSCQGEAESILDVFDVVGFKNHILIEKFDHVVTVRSRQCQYYGSPLSFVTNDRNEYQCTSCNDLFELFYDMSLKPNKNSDFIEDKNIKVDSVDSYRDRKEANTESADYVPMFYKSKVKEENEDAYLNKSTSLESEYKCIDCKKVFPGKYKLHRHRYRVHNIRGESVVSQKAGSLVKKTKKPCFFCRLSFKTTSMLITHLRSDHKDKPLQELANIIPQLDVDQLSMNEVEKILGPVKMEEQMESDEIEGSTTLRCSFCPCNFESFLNLLSHTRNSHVNVDKSNSHWTIKMYVELEKKWNNQTTSSLIAAASSSVALNNNVVIENITELKDNLKCKFCTESFGVRKEFEYHLITEHASDGEKVVKTTSKLEKQPEDFISSDEEDDGNAGELDLKNLPLNFNVKLEDGVTNEFICSDCNKDYHTKRQLSRHRYKVHKVLTRAPHTGPKKGKPCFFCPISLPNLTKLINHLSTIHKDKNLKYLTDLIPSLNAEDLERDNIQKFVVPKEEVDTSIPNPDGRATLVRCDFCPLDFETFGQLLSHVRYGHKDVDKSNADWKIKLFYALDEKWPSAKTTCLTCDKQVKEERLQRHMYNHRVGPKQCELCEKSIQRKSWKRHMERHNKGARDWMCSECAATFNNRYSYRHHVITHDPNYRRLECKECGKLFGTNQYLARHFKKVHTKHERQAMECEQCSFKTFSGEKGLSLHVKGVHDNVRPYLCQHCSYSTVTSNNLTNHIKRVHTREKPHQCDLCEYECCTRLDLARHKFAKHERENHHKCELCSWTSPRPHLIVKHMRVKHNIGSKTKIEEDTLLEFEETSETLLEFEETSEC